VPITRNAFERCQKSEPSRSSFAPRKFSAVPIILCAVPIILCACGLTLLLAAFCPAQTVPSTSPSDSTQPAASQAEILAALDREAAAFSPTITLAWDEHREPPLTPKEYADATGFKRFDHHKTFSQDEKVNLTWQSDGHYLLAYRQLFHPSGTDRTILRFNLHFSFDGTTFYLRGANPGEDHSLTRSDFQNEEDSDDDINMDYFAFMGFPLPADPDELQKHQPLRSAVQLLLKSDDTQLIAIEPATIDNHKLVELQLKRGPNSSAVDGDVEDIDSLEGTEFIYLDPARGYAQVRRQHFDANNKLLFQEDSSDFREFPPRGIFLPRSVVVATYDPGKASPNTRLTLAVNTIGFDPLPASSFVLSDSTPGTWIIDHTGPTQHIYIVQKDGTLRPKRTN
jgi:hypothetical protein